MHGTVNLNSSTALTPPRFGVIAREVGLFAHNRAFQLSPTAMKAIAVMQGADISADAEFSTVTAAWFGALGSKQGFFFAMMARQLATVIPLYSAVGIAAGYLAGSTHGEGEPTVLSRTTYARDRLAPRTSIGIAAVTRELVAAGGPGAIQSIEDAASLGVIFSTDGDIHNEVTGSTGDGAPASGATAADFFKDARAAMLTVFGPGQPTNRGFWVASPQAAIALSTLTTTTGALACPDMRPDGGSLLGLVVLVSPAWENDLTLFDGAQIAAGADDLGISASLQASFSAALAPTNNAATASGAENLISAWQTGAIVYQTRTRYSFGLARAGAAYTIGGASGYGS